MNEVENVIRYYTLCNTLKSLVRTGWQKWNVQADRLESVAEHIYGVQMLAIAMYSEFKYDIDIYKVILMLSVHELEEIIIGDFTPFQISKEEKEKLGHEAINKVLDCLLDKEQIKSLILEFDERKTEEAKFAYYCDKLECDLQCKLYDEQGLVDITKPNDVDAIENKRINEILANNMSWSEMWLKNGQDNYNYDDHFKAVSDYALTHNIRQGDNLNVQ